MKALVTGATGFVGSAVAKRLVADGHDIRPFVRNPDKLKDVGLCIEDVAIGDITDADSVDKALESIDVVFAIAGTFREPNLSDDQYHQINVGAVRTMIEAASRHGVRRVVHCSTVGIHGNVVGPPASEKTPINPDGIYEETKAEGDALARRLGRELGIEVVVLRPTPIYGPGDTRLLKLFKMANKSRMIMLGSGTAGYHLVHIEDLADAFLLAATADTVDGEAFIIGGSERPSLNDMVKTLADVLGQQNQQIIRLPAGPIRLAGHLCEIICRPLNISPPIYRRRVDFFINNRSYDIAKAQSMLSYAPQVTMRQGLQQTADWYRSQGML